MAARPGVCHTSSLPPLHCTPNLFALREQLMTAWMFCRTNHHTSVRPPAVHRQPPLLVRGVSMCMRASVARPLSRGSRKPPRL